MRAVNRYNQSMAERTCIHLEHEPNLIWATNDLPDRIGLRFDCGDAGVILLNQQKTQEVIDELQLMQKAMGWAGRTA
jgi:hypothetical protein